MAPGRDELLRSPANEHAHRLVTDAMLQAEHTVEDHPRHHQ
jgi:hypothetical protein